MDQSDKLRALQAKTIFAYYRDTKLSIQPACNYSTCSTIFPDCLVNYPSYAERQNVVTGSAECNRCSGGSCGCVG
jgi:hypothetical protein